MKTKRSKPQPAPAEGLTWSSLQRSRQWLELCSSHEFGLLVLQRDVIADANETAARLFGLSRQEILGRAFTDLAAPEARSEVARAIGQCVDERLETLGLHSDGRLFPLEVHGRSWEQNGQLARMLMLRDLSGSRQAEAAARQFEARYLALAEAAHDMIFVIGRDDLVQYVNSFAASYLGKRPEEIIGKPRAEFFPASTNSSQAIALRRVFESGQPYYAERLHPFPGRELWLGTWLSPIRDEAGQVVAVQGISRDITEQVRAQEALRLQSLALNSADNGIVITDRQGTVAWVNPAFSRLTGHAPTEILGKNLRLLKSGAHPPEFYQGMWAAIQQGQVWHGEITNRRKDGSCYTQEQTITPVRDARGEISHFIAIQQDITSRKRMEAELRESHERFARVFHFNPAAIVITSVPHRRFVDVNKSFLEALGLTREEVIGRTAEDLGLFVDPQDLERLRDSLSAQGRLQNFETRFRGRNNRVFEVLMSVEPIQLGTEPCWLAMVVDITHWKQQYADMAEKLRRAAKLESIGTLAGGIAHDFNNILTVIQGHTALLLESEELSAENHESLSQVQQAAERAANLTRQLLTFSRQQNLERVPLDLNEVVGNMTKMLCRIIGEDITLEIRCSSRLPVVLGDAGMMEQLLMNLAVNARDAIHARRQPGRQGRLVIGTEFARSCPPRHGDGPAQPLRECVCLTVQDNGCGIPESLQDRIFDPFFTTKEVGKGTGLGLATVHGIVQEHHGWMDLESQVNEGTIFRIYLPARPREERSVQTGDRAAPVLGGYETILLVEDEEPVRRLAREILERYGYKVLPAASGREALEVWDRHAPGIQLLLTDEIMPEGLTGRQLAEILHVRQPGLKVILSTGYDSEPVHEAEWIQREVFHVRKPYSPRELAQVVRQCLDGSRPPSA